MRHLGRPTTPLASATRLDWPDVLRGACVVAVVLYHLHIWVYDALPSDSRLASVFLRQVDDRLGIFRMPVLLVMSGLLASRGLRAGWRSGTAVLRAATNGYLYVVWLVLYLAVFTAAAGTGYPPLVASPADALRQLVVPHTPLWFLLALGVYALVLRSLIWLRVPPAVVLGVGLGLMFVPEAPGYIELTKVATHFIFFAAGVHLADPLRRLARPNRWAAIIATVTLLGLLAVVNEILDGLGLLGWNLIRLVVVVPVLVLAGQVAGWRPLPAFGRTVGRRTLAIYVLHLPMLIPVWWSAVPDGAPLARFATDPVGGLLFVVGAVVVVVLLSLAADRLLRRIPGNPLLGLPPALRRHVPGPQGPRPAKTA